MATLIKFILFQKFEKYGSNASKKFGRVLLCRKTEKLPGGESKPRSAACVRQDTHNCTTLDSYIKFEVAQRNMFFIFFNPIKHIRTPVSRVIGGDTHHYTTENSYVQWEIAYTNRAYFP